MSTQTVRVLWTPLFIGASPQMRKRKVYTWGRKSKYRCKRLVLHGECYMLYTAAATAGLSRNSSVLHADAPQVSVTHCTAACGLRARPCLDSGAPARDSLPRRRSLLLHSRYSIESHGRHIRLLSLV